MNPLLFAGGLVLLVVVGVDVLATTTASGSATGSGPITARLSRRIWSVALAVNRRRRSHRVLHFVGLGMILGIVTAWIVTIWIAWALIFASDPGSVVHDSTGAPADAVESAYFVGYSLLTLGNGEFIPATSGWQLATLVAAGTGLGLVTLAVTYVLNVVQAGNRRRSLATMIWSLGDTADDIVGRAKHDGANLGHQLWTLLDPMVLVREQHVAFPVLHYLHTTDSHRSLPVQAAKLADAVRRLRGGVDAPDGLSPSILESVARVLHEYASAVDAFGPVDVRRAPDGALHDPGDTDDIDTDRMRASAGWPSTERH